MSIRIKTINLGFVNCYLVKTSAGFILIDTGGCTVFNTRLSAIRSLLEKELEDEGCKAGNLILAILTHGHTDHTGNCAYLRKKYGTPIAMHPSDSDMVENGAFPEIKQESLIAKIFMAFVEPRLKKIYDEFDRFKPDLTIDEGFDLSEYGFDAKISHLPGHTKGSIGIITSEGAFFSGDFLVNYSGKPTITTQIVENSNDLNSSIAKLRKLSITTVYPGHGKPFPMEKFLENCR